MRTLISTSLFCPVKLAAYVTSRATVCGRVSPTTPSKAAMNFCRLRVLRNIEEDMVAPVPGNPPHLLSGRAATTHDERAVKNESRSR